MRISARYAIALVAALGLIPIALDSTIVNVAIIPISHALKSDVNTVQWIFIGYLLANAAVVTLGGYLGNRFGVKRLFMLGLALFTLFSALCGLAPTESWLITARIFQGIGGGFLMPLGMAIALQPFAQEERARATAVIAIPVLLAPVFGPIVGGLLIDNIGWQSIFLINLPVGVLGVLLSGFILPSDEPATAQEGQRFDYLGLLLCTLGVVALIYGFKLVSQTNPATQTVAHPAGTIYGWGYWQVWALIGGGLAMLIAFAVQSWRSSHDPVLDLRLFRRRDFWSSNLVLWGASIISFGVLFLIPVYLQQVRLPGLSALDTGLALVPLSIGTLLGVVLGGGFYRRIGARPLVVVGNILFIVSFWHLRDLTPSIAVSDLRFWLFLLGLSVTLTAVPVQTLALEALSGPVLTKATSLVNATKLLFGSVGSAILVTLFVQQTTWHATHLAAALRHGLLSGATTTTHHTSPAAIQAQLAAQAGTAALNDVFTILVFCSLALLALSLVVPGHASASAESSPERGKLALETH